MLAAAALAAGFVPCAAVVVAVDALAAAWLAAIDAFAASAVLFKLDKLPWVFAVFVNASASAASFADVSGVVVVATAVGSVLSPCLLFASPRSVPLADVLPLAEAFTDRSVSSFDVAAPVAALPTLAACAGTALCVPLSAASAACNASLADFASADASRLPWCAPSVLSPPVVPGALVPSVSVVLASPAVCVFVPPALASALA